MAKHNCAICGAEVGLMSEQKLADGNYICRKICSKKTFKVFDKVSATLDDVNAHIAQIKKVLRSGMKYSYPFRAPRTRKKSSDRSMA